MSATQILSPVNKQPDSSPSRQPWWRLPTLCALLLLSLAITIFEAGTAPPPDTPLTAFLITYMLSFAPYLAACLLVFATAAPHGNARWIEMGLILGGALIMRALLLPLNPDLSHD